MKRIFHPYHKWECFNNGLYKDEKRDRDGRVQHSIILLRNLRELEKHMLQVVNSWTHSSEVYLSHKGYNRRAWLGQAACCLHHGASEDETKEAWNFLSFEEMSRANNVADRVISLWEEGKAK